LASSQPRDIGAGLRLSYLGPAGTFTEEAASVYAPLSRLIPFPTISATASAVLHGESDQAVTPIENSLQGAVTDTLDLLIHGEGLFIYREIVIPIVHNLIAVDRARIPDIRTVYSHPQALGQCRKFLERMVPNAELAASLSTAAAVGEALSIGRTAAAIAPSRAAKLYGGVILETNIQDDFNNVTRFVVLGSRDHTPTGDDKTSICLSFDEDKPGLLYRVMGEMAGRGINLSKVESRPTREGLGSYYFLIDLVGHREEDPVADALHKIKGMATMLKVFGSYPRYSDDNIPRES
jgi:prephenate dehydratase